MVNKHSYAVKQCTSAFYCEKVFDLLLREIFGTPYLIKYKKEVKDASTDHRIEIAG